MAIACQTLVSAFTAKRSRQVDDVASRNSGMLGSPRRRHILTELEGWRRELGKATAAVLGNAKIAHPVDGPGGHFRVRHIGMGNRVRACGALDR
jgi:hypothetical protein